MKLGIALTKGHDEPSGDFVSRRARAAEKHGLDSVWFFDSLGRGGMSLDPLVGVGAAAAVTERVEVGTCILQTPIRNAVELANRVLTAQLVCEGRLLLGVGAGSSKTEFDIVGVPFEERMRRFDDGLATMRRLWNGEPVDGVSLDPLPDLLGGPPVLIGSWAGSRWIPRAAKEFDGWISSAFYAGFDTLKAGIEAYRAAGGQRAIVTNISLDLSADAQLLDDVAGPFTLMCGPDEASRRLQRLAAIGYDDAIVVHRGTGEPDFAAIRSLLPT
ncbi:MAG: LLM class flavin-dependent oxidoreductase [Chloroflexi bacterium]|nr:LLM class flavin-dependent oxidoreductase [Chloroflexota bacterium]